MIEESLSTHEVHILVFTPDTALMTMPGFSSLLFETKTNLKNLQRSLALGLVSYLMRNVVTDIRIIA
jgi:hypothetical protein